MAMRDESHEEASIDELFNEATSVITEYEEKFHQMYESGVHPKVKTTIERTDAGDGVVVGIAFMAPRGYYCKCKHLDTCKNKPHGKFPVKTTDHYIKCRNTLAALRYALILDLKWYGGFGSDD
jgi:hypothetical protein